MTRGEHHCCSTLKYNHGTGGNPSSFGHFLGAMAMWKLPGAAAETRPPDACLPANPRHAAKASRERRLESQQRLGMWVTSCHKLSQDSDFGGHYLEGTDFRWHWDAMRMVYYWLPRKAPFVDIGDGLLASFHIRIGDSPTTSWLGGSRSRTGRITCFSVMRITATIDYTGEFHQKPCEVSAIKQSWQEPASFSC